MCHLRFKSCEEIWTHCSGGRRLWNQAISPIPVPLCLPFTPSRLPPINRWEEYQPAPDASSFSLSWGENPPALAAKHSLHSPGSYFPTSPWSRPPVCALLVFPQSQNMPALLEGRPLPGRVPALPRLAASSLSDTRAISAAAAVLALAVLCHHPFGDLYVCCLFSSLEYSFLRAGPSSVLFTLEPQSPEQALPLQRCFLGVNEWLEFQLTPFTIRP